MKILMPVNDAATIQRVSGESELIEFYIGFEDSAWYDRFGPTEDLNRMSAFRDGANMSSDLLSEVSAAAKKNSRDLYITVNAGIYSHEQEVWLRDKMDQFRQCGVTGVIIGDPCLAVYAKKIGLRCVASTMVGVYNADIATNCRDLGFDRVILPRDLTIEEIKTIVESVPDIEYECFIMRNGCRYSDSHCLCRHSDRYGAICAYLDRAKDEIICNTDDFTLREEAAFNHRLFSQAFHKDACGMCALWDLEHLSITAGKIVGRADGIQTIWPDVLTALENIKIAQTSESQDEYLERMKYPGRRDRLCLKGLNCYYPEVRYKEVKQ